MFSQACVKNSVHGGGMHGRGMYVVGGMCGKGACMAGGVHGGGMHGRGHAWQGRHMWQGACMAGGACVVGDGMCMAGDATAADSTHPKYWNAFLFDIGIL